MISVQMHLVVTDIMNRKRKKRDGTCNSKEYQDIRMAQLASGVGKWKKASLNDYPHI